MGANVDRQVHSIDEARVIACEKCHHTPESLMNCPTKPAIRSAGRNTPHPAAVIASNCAYHFPTPRRRLSEPRYSCAKLTISLVQKIAQTTCKKVLLGDDVALIFIAAVHPQRFVQPVEDDLVFVR